MIEPLLHYEFYLEPKYVINLNRVTEGMNPKCFQKAKWGIWGAFLDMKRKVQKQTKEWILENKIEPMPRQVREKFYVGNLKKSNRFDPVNYHTIEKPCIDTFVKEGILEDDNYMNIPEVTFLPLPQQPRKLYQFILEFYPYPFKETETDSN